MPIEPFLSIVTPCLNRAGMIVEAVESVLAQGYPHFEHLVMDGGSTDGTLEILRRYPHLRIVSEPDLGLYDAINKGIRLARGDIIGHLNSDDVYPHGLFQEIAAPFINDPQLEMVSGGATIFTIQPDGSQQVIRETISSNDVELSLHNILTTGLLNINARFFRRGIYDRVGLYDIRYRIAADWDFLLRVYLAGVTQVTLPRIAYRYLQHPGSLTITGRSLTLGTKIENLRVLESYLCRPALSSRVKVLLRVRHALELAMLRQAWSSSGAFGTVLGEWVRGTRFNWSWPWLYARGAALRAGGRLFDTCLRRPNRESNGG